MVKTLRGLTAGLAAAALIISISGCSVLEQLREGPLVLTGEVITGEWTMGDRTPTGKPTTLTFHEDGTFSAQNTPSELVCWAHSEDNRPPECTGAGAAVEISGTWKIPEDVSSLVWMYFENGWDVRGGAYIGFSGPPGVYTLDFYVGSLDVPEPSYSFHRPRDAQHFPDLY